MSLAFRSKLLVLLLFCAVAIAAVNSCSVAKAGGLSSPKPNIVVIMTDDQDTQSLAYMPKTKALLADKGVTFSNSFVQFPQCCPSRSTWLSGQFAHNHHVLGNSTSWGGAYPAWKVQESNSLPVWMQNAGYTTGFFGKVMNAFNAEPYHVPPGWTVFRAMKTTGYYNWTIYKANGTIGTLGATAADYSTDNYLPRAQGYVTAHPEPFLNMSWLFAPHIDGSGEAVPAPRHVGAFATEPMPMSPAFNSTHTTGKHPLVQGFPAMTPTEVATMQESWRRYIETLQSVDDYVEGIVTSLETSGRIGNTYIIFTSDNGSLWGDWKRPGKALPYERSIKVPLIIRGPGVPEGITRSELVTNADVAATLVDLADALPGRTLDGRSMVPLLSTAPVAWRTAQLLTGMYDPQQAYDTNYIRWNAVRTRTRKYIRSSDGHEELYDLTADPWEHFNVMTDPYYAGDVVALRALEYDLRTCAGITCWR